jgi:hypothetical protein
MAFCTNCGANVNGSFCAQCGKPVGGAQPAASTANQPASLPANPAPQSKKISPIVWIVVGIVGFCMLIGILVAAAGLYVAHKVTQNPALAMAKLMAAGNPNVEVLSSDSGRNTVTFRDKHTGETVTMNFDDIKKGKILFKGNGKEASIQAHGEGENGTLEINSAQGSLKIGAGSAAKIPDWVPAYPGVTPEATFSLQGADGDSGSFHFTSKDSPKEVLSFYQRGLKDAGFTIGANFAGDTATSSGGMLSAENESSKRTVMVTVGTEKGSSEVNLVFGTKK